MRFCCAPSCRSRWQLLRANRDRDARSSLLDKELRQLLEQALLTHQIFRCLVVGAVLHIVGLRLAPGERIDLLDMADILLAYFKAPSIGEIQCRLGMPLVELSEDMEAAHIVIRSVLEMASAESFPIVFIRAAALREFRASAAGPALQFMLEWHVELTRLIAENRAEREDVVEADVSFRVPASSTDTDGDSQGDPVADEDRLVASVERP